MATAMAPNANGLSEWCAVSHRRGTCVCTPGWEVHLVCAHDHCIRCGYGVIGYVRVVWSGTLQVGVRAGCARETRMFDLEAPPAPAPLTDQQLRIVAEVIVKQFLRRYPSR